MNKTAQRIPEVVDVSAQTVFTKTVRDFQSQVLETYSTPGSIVSVIIDHNYAKKSTMLTPFKLNTLKLSPKLLPNNRYLSYFHNNY